MRLPSSPHLCTGVSSAARGQKYWAGKGLQAAVAPPAGLRPRDGGRWIPEHNPLRTLGHLVAGGKPGSRNSHRVPFAD